ncbi:MAG: hypothetical protein AAF689_18505 [Pseudomonadota bacterium]
MASTDPSFEPDASIAHQLPRAVRHDGWTPDKQIAFLQTLAATGSVAAAARSVGMSRQSAYKLRARLDDAPFGAAWRQATQSGRELLVEAALERAINGVEVPHYWQGELVGTSRRFDERLTTALLTSGALRGPARAQSPAETEYAEHELARLLDRITNGPAQWCDFETERDFAYGDDLADEDFGEDREEKGDEGQGEGRGEARL